jgi:hypothetical protein
MRVDLKVPFAEKDDAKRLGARWDVERKVWYVPDGLDASKFAQWMRRGPDITILSERYFIAQSESQCWKCRKACAVFCFALPPGHLVREPDCDDDQTGEVVEGWHPRDELAFVQYVTDLLPSVEKQISGFTPHYRLDFSKTVGRSYWMNHCQACGMKQGDFELHCEPSGAFLLIDAREAARVTLHHVAKPFACNGDLSDGEEFAYAMRRR